MLPLIKARELISEVIKPGSEAPTRREDACFCSLEKSTSVCEAEDGGEGFPGGFLSWEPLSSWLDVC